MTKTPSGRIVGTVRLQSQQPLSELEDDSFKYADYAEMLASVADSPGTPTPFTLAVSGDWGIGKTTLLSFVQTTLEGRPSSLGAPAHAVVFFDAWLHNDQPNIKASLFQEIVAETHEMRPWMARLRRPVHPWLLGKVPFASAIKALLGSLVAVFFLTWWALATPDNTSATEALILVATELDIALALPGEVWNSDTGRAGAVLGLAFAAIRFCQRLLDPLGQLRNSHDARSSYLSIQNMKRNLAAYIADVTKRRRLIILIDNLDRCNESNVQAVIEGMDQLLQVDNTIVMVAADVRRLERMVEKVEPGLAPGEGRRFLQKVFHAQFDVPTPPAASLPEALRESSRAEEEKVNNVSMTVGETWIMALDRLVNPVSSHWTHPDALDDIRIKAPGWRAWLAVPLMFPLMTDTITVAVASIYPRTLRSGWKANYPPWYVFRSPQNAFCWLAFAASLFAAWTWGADLLPMTLLIGLMISHWMAPHLLLAYMYRKDQWRLNEHRIEVEDALREERNSPSARVPIRLRKRVLAVRNAARLSIMLHEDPDVRRTQELLLHGLEMTPREFKRWTMRVRFLAVINRQRKLGLATNQLTAFALLQERAEDLPKQNRAQATKLIGQDKVALHHMAS